MSLLLPGRPGRPSNKGNPGWAKGKSGNPEGRPRLGSTMGVKLTLAKLKRNPVQELINLADLCSANKDYNTAIKIWDKLYDDSFDAGLNVEKEQKSTQQLLEDMEKDEPRIEPRSSTESSNSVELGNRPTQTTP